MDDVSGELWTSLSKLRDIAYFVGCKAKKVGGLNSNARGPHMNQTKFRLAVPEEAELVKAISARAYIPAYQQVIGAVPKPAFEDYGGRIADGEVWLATTDGHASGVLVLENKAKFLMIYSLAVDPGFQGRGIGKSLLEHAGRCAAEMGISELRLYTNVRMKMNVALYVDCGFIEFGRRPHPSRKGEVLIDMLKQISAAELK